jgi:hypothetical protein
MLANATAERAGYESQLQTVRERIEKLNGQASSLFPVRADYRKLTRDVEQRQRQMAFWEDNLRRVRMALTAESGDRGVKLDFIKPCGEIGRPVSPDLFQVLAAAVALSLLAGTASVFFAHRTDESFGTGDALAAALNLPLFGSVSEIISRKQRSLRRLRNAFVYPMNAAAMGAVLLALVAVLYMSLERPELFAEFRKSPTRFVTGRVSLGPQSAKADEGRGATPGKGEGREEQQEPSPTPGSDRPSPLAPRPSIFSGADKDRK